MNGWKTTIGIEFDDKYIEAKNKLLDCVKTLNDLNPAQREQLIRETIVSMSMAMSFEQFAYYMNGGN